MESQHLDDAVVTSQGGPKETSRSLAIK